MYKFVVNGVEAGSEQSSYDEAISTGKYLCMKYRARVDIYRHDVKTARYVWTHQGAKRMDTFIHKVAYGMEGLPKPQTAVEMYESKVCDHKSYSEAAKMSDALRIPRSNIQRKLVYS